MSQRLTGRRSSAVLCAAGFLMTAAGAAFAFWTVNVIVGSGSYALAQANSLSAPSAPTATVNGSGAITIGWTLPATQLAGGLYQVTRTSGPGSPTSLCTVASTSCQDTGLTGGTAYGYSISAVLQNWQSASIATSATTAKGSQTITFTSTAPTGATVGGATYTAAATSSSGLAVTITSATTSVCTVSGSTVSFSGAGTCTLNASQAGDANYNPATQVQQSFAVAAAPLTITSAVPGNGKRVYFTGTGGTVGSTVTVTICTTNNFPSCTSVGTATATVLANGTWQTGQSANLDSGTTYYSRAVQGSPSKTSAVFQFTGP